MAQKLPKSRHGRWYTRDVDDTVDQRFDPTPAVFAMVDTSQLRDDEDED